jgi:hypothetical protein
MARGDPRTRPPPLGSAREDTCGTCCRSDETQVTPTAYLLGDRMIMPPLALPLVCLSTRAPYQPDIYAILTPLRSERPYQLRTFPHQAHVRLPCHRRLERRRLGTSRPGGVPAAPRGRRLPPLRACAAFSFPNTGSSCLCKGKTALGEGPLSRSGPSKSPVRWGVVQNCSPSYLSELLRRKDVGYGSSPMVPRSKWKAST